MTRMIVLFLLTISMTSCDYWNVKIDDMDDTPQTDYGVVKKSKYQSLNDSRKLFLSQHLRPMQVQVSDVLNLKQEFTSLAQDLKNKLDTQDQDRIVTEVNKLNEQFYVELAKILGKTISELSHEDLSNENIILLHSEYLQLHLPELSTPELDLTREEESQLGRIPKSTMKLIVGALAAYSIYSTIEETVRVR